MSPEEQPTPEPEEKAENAAAPMRQAEVPEAEARGNSVVINWLLRRPRWLEPHNHEAALRSLLAETDNLLTPERAEKLIAEARRRMNEGAR